MNISRNQAVISACVVLAIILLGAFIAAKMTDNKEQEVAKTITEMYQEEFIAVNSTASLMSNIFDVTVQSEQTKNVYNFHVAGDSIQGNYYNENVNMELNKLIESTTKSFAMVNAKMDKLDQPATISEAGIQEISAIIIAPKEMEEATANEIAEAIRKETGPIPIQFEILIVENETDYNGVTFEIKNYFQRSSVTKSSFGDLKYEEQVFEF